MKSRSDPKVEAAVLIDGLERCIAALLPLSDRAKWRILRFVVDHFDETDTEMQRKTAARHVDQKNDNAGKPLRRSVRQGAIPRHEGRTDRNRKGDH
jgi:hypothetical protein